jgi:hypothetical protein
MLEYMVVHVSQMYGIKSVNVTNNNLCWAMMKGIKPQFTQAYVPEIDSDDPIS